MIEPLSIASTHRRPHTMNSLNKRVPCASADEGLAVTVEASSRSGALIEGATWVSAPCSMAASTEEASAAMDGARAIAAEGSGPRAHALKSAANAQDESRA